MSKSNLPQHPEQARSGAISLINHCQEAYGGPVFGGTPSHSVSMTQALFAERVVFTHRAARWLTTKSDFAVDLHTRWGEDRTPTRSDCLHFEVIE